MTLEELHNDKITCPACEGYLYPMLMIGFMITFECDRCEKQFRHDLRERLTQLEGETEERSDG